jgi:hypothetical protein
VGLTKCGGQGNGGAAGLMQMNRNARCFCARNITANIIAHVTLGNIQQVFMLKKILPKICACSGCRRCQFISTKRDTLRKVKEFRTRSKVTFSNSPRAITVLVGMATDTCQSPISVRSRRFWNGRARANCTGRF